MLPPRRRRLGDGEDVPLGRRLLPSGDPEDRPLPTDSPFCPAIRSDADRRPLDAIVLPIARSGGCHDFISRPGLPSLLSPTPQACAAALPPARALTSEAPDFVANFSTAPAAPLRLPAPSRGDCGGDLDLDRSDRTSVGRPPRSLLPFQRVRRRSAAARRSSAPRRLWASALAVRTACSRSAASLAISSASKHATLGVFCSADVQRRGGDEQKGRYNSSVLQPSEDARVRPL